MRRHLGAAALTVVLTLGVGSAVAANHDHDLITPGTTVVDIADGTTERCPGEPSGHTFHDNVHKGQPGLFAFELANNPVSIIKTEEADCD